jgi:hypothetical protein
MIKKWGHTSTSPFCLNLVLKFKPSSVATTLGIMTFSPIRLSVVVQSVAMLNAVTLSVMAPLRILFVYNFKYGRGAWQPLSFTREF